MVVLGALLSVLLSGLLIGALARLALPGPDPLSFGLTILLGLAGSLIGGGISTAVYGTKHAFDTSDHAFVTLLLEIGAAVLILALYRRLVQRRPLSGPGAHSFPTRYKGRMVGSLGAISAFSTMFGKQHCTGAQGGVVFTKNTLLFARARQVADRGKPYGAVDNPTNLVASLNFNQDEISMAIGRERTRRECDDCAR